MMRPLGDELGEKYQTSMALVLLASSASIGNVVNASQCESD
jgi:hypothetical protein